MPREGKSVTWLLIKLLQKRELPWPTLFLVGATITAHARVSRYSAWRKKNWSDDQWLAFLEEGKRLREECEAAVEKFYWDTDFTELNASLEKVRRGLIEADAGGDSAGPSGASAPTREPADVRSINWLLRSFILGGPNPADRPPHSIIHLLYEADARAFPLRASAAEGGTSGPVDAYDRLYRECERCIAAFFEDSDRAALNSRLGEILQEMTALGVAQA